jgi:hypothetical protein
MSILEYKENVKPGSRKDSLGTLIAARDEDGVGLSHMELVSAGLVFMIAGLSGTTYSTNIKVRIQRQLRSLIFVTFLRNIQISLMSFLKNSPSTRASTI